MKTLSANLLCCNCQLYKLGLLIGFTYLIPNLLVAIYCFHKDYDNFFTLPFFSMVTVITSILLIKGLMQERPYYLLPWMANITILILFNIILFTVQFNKFSSSDTKSSFYLELIFLIGLGFQILCWYCIYFLMEKGCQNAKLSKASIDTISQDITKADNKGFFKHNLNLSASEANYNDKEKIIQV